MEVEAERSNENEKRQTILRLLVAGQGTPVCIEPLYLHFGCIPPCPHTPYASQVSAPYLALVEGGDQGLLTGKGFDIFDYSDSHTPYGVRKSW
jgi:hypothetical protein